MLTTVNFDNQPCFQTYEVEDVAFERMLTSEFVPRHLSLTQGDPPLEGEGTLHPSLTLPLKGRECTSTLIP